jgi:glycosyltransferase involved in cell wall biosynthesis
MRLLILTYEFPPLGGGAGNAVAELVRALGNRPDLEIVVVTSSTGDYEVKHRTMTANSTIYCLPVGKQDGNLHFQTNPELWRYSRACHRFLKKLLEKETFDCCHAHMTVPAGVNAWRFRKKVPYLVSLQGSDVPRYSERYKALYTFLTPIILRIWKDAASVVSNSVGLRTLALESAPQQRIEVIPNGIDLALFSPKDGKSTLSEPDGDSGKRRVVCVCRLIERKGVWELLKGFQTVAREMPDTHLDLIGAGILDELVKQWVDEQGLGDRVTLHGAVAHDEIPEYLRRAALFVLPSHAEGMSNALLEGMACGLPIVVTDTGGTAELLKDNGLVVPKKNPAAIAEAIIEILGDEKKRVEMGEASLKIARTFSWKAMARKYMELYTWTEHPRPPAPQV